MSSYWQGFVTCAGLVVAFFASIAFGCLLASREPPPPPNVTDINESRRGK